MDKTWQLMMLVIVLTGLLAVPLAAQDALKPQPLPPLLNPVSDAAHVLSISEGSALMDLLYRIEKTTRTRVIMLILPTVAPETIGAYVERLANYWRDRGGIREGGRFVFVVIAKEDGMMRIWPSRSLAWVLKPLEESEAMREVPELLADDKYYQALNGIARTLARMIQETRS